MNINPLLLTDGYKAGHYQQYPEGTELVVSNLTARKAQYSQTGETHCVFFGLQYYIKRLQESFKRDFFERPKDEVVEEYRRQLTHYVGNDYVGHIEALHDLQYLPININAVSEGTLVPIGTPMMAIWNTLPEFYWLTNSLETHLSATLWGMINSATIARRYRINFEKYYELTCDAQDMIPFAGHDFSYRGMFGSEAAILSGMGHLTSFAGTDTIPAVVALEKYYNADVSKELVGCSVNATEHSVQCMNAITDGDPDDRKYLERLLEIYPTGIVSMVSDGFDFWKMITEILPEYKDQIMSRDGKLVIRPDSGDPADIICGISDRCELEDDEYFECYYDQSNHNTRTIKIHRLEHEVKGLIECLWDTFGGTINSKGYKVLDPHIGAIYGDSITKERQLDILERLNHKGFSAENIVLGIGSYTYQYNTRDCLGMAVKATFGRVNGEDRPIYKDPKTGDGTKKSAKGLVWINPEDLTYEDEVSWGKFQTGALKPVFVSGKLAKETSLEEIRNQLRKSIHLDSQNNI